MHEAIAIVAILKDDVFRSAVPVCQSFSRYKDVVILTLTLYPPPPVGTTSEI